jgi:hypothetical protein
MSHQWLRCNLMANIFPMATELWGRSVIVAQYDENYERTMVSPADVSKDKGIPQVYYLHNTMPTSHGYQAIGYNVAIDGVPGDTSFDQAFPIQSVQGNKFLFVPANGNFWVYNVAMGAWKKSFFFPSGTFSAEIFITTAFLQQESFIAVSQMGLFQYDDVAELILPIPTPGLNIISDTSIIGVCAANGYLIVWDETSVAWQLGLPIDFTPSLITGAGGGAINDAKGKLIACLPVTGGFIIYCEKNAVAATFTGNFNAPFTFVEIEAAGGISAPDEVSWQADLGYHLAWTTFGLQQIGLNGAQFVYPEVTGFLAQKLFEDFNETTLTFTEEYLSEPLNVAINVVECGYMIISYGLPTLSYFTHALVLDLNLARWGKMKINHVDCFQFPELTAETATTFADLMATPYTALMGTTYGELFAIDDPVTAKETLAFLGQDGTVSTVDFDLSEANADGVFLLGKYQLTRNQYIDLHRVDVENVGSGSTYNLNVFPTIDGKNFQPPVAGVVIQGGEVGDKEIMYGFDTSSYNVSLLFTGSFNLTSVLIDISAAGNI